MPRIDQDRLLSDLHELRAIGAQDRGVVRPAFSAADMDGRRWLKRRYEDAGLDATIDGVGNVLGRSRHAGKALLIGSHSDTQPTGGWLDGALGVIYALEVVRSLAVDEATRALPVDAVSFQDEESRFIGCLGSRSLTGTLAPEVELEARDSRGVALADALRDAGLAGVPRLRLARERYAGFIEAHIEQGPQLEDTGHRMPEMISAEARINDTLTTLLPRASPMPIWGAPASAALTDTDNSGLEVAKAATVTATMPGEIRSQRAMPTAPRTNSSPPKPAQTMPASRER